MLRRAIEIDDMLLVTHWVMLFYGLGVGGFALFRERILECRFGSISLLLGSGYTLPIRHRRLFFLFYIKDILYYILLTILPMVVGLALASVFVSISLISLMFIFISLTLSFLLGISTSVLLFTISVRWGTPPILILSAAAGTYLVADGFTVSSISRALPPTGVLPHPFSIPHGGNTGNSNTVCSHILQISERSTVAPRALIP